MPQYFTTGSALLANATGLHARPSVRLTQLARTFAGPVEVATDAAGPWIDAKSPVKLLRLRAPRGTTLHVRSSGAAAESAVAAIVELIRRQFDEAPDASHSGAAHE